VISDRATISVSSSSTASNLPFYVEEHLQFNSPCSSPNVLSHNEDLSPSQTLPFTPPSISQTNTDVTILNQILPTIFIVPNESQPQRTHSMITRSMNQIYKPKQFHVVTKHLLPHAIEPSCVRQALCDPR